MGKLQQKVKTKIQFVESRIRISKGLIYTYYVYILYAYYYYHYCYHYNYYYKYFVLIYFRYSHPIEWGSFSKKGPFWWQFFPTPKNAAPHLSRYLGRSNLDGFGVDGFGRETVHLSPNSFDTFEIFMVFSTQGTSQPPKKTISYISFCHLLLTLHWHQISHEKWISTTSISKTSIELSHQSECWQK